MTEIHFKYTTITDVSGVMSCMKDNIFHNIKDPKNGRLFYEIPESELAGYINNTNNIFLCAKESHTVIGYALAYRIDAWINKKKNRFDSLQIPSKDKEIFRKEKTLYWRHVAVKQTHQGA